MDFSAERWIGLFCALPALVIGLTVHEFAHAWSGWRLGDDTPRREGRVTLDPLAHLDPLGSLFFLVMWFSGWGLAWAKPVMINHRNLVHPRRDSVLVALAGPVSNLLQVPIWLLALYGFGLWARSQGVELSLGSADLPSLVLYTLFNGVVLNIMLAAFNMVPIPPLDGHWVLEGLGGRPVSELFDTIRPYSFLILIGLINFTPFFNVVLRPVSEFAGMLAVRAYLGV